MAEIAHPINPLLLHDILAIALAELAEVLVGFVHEEVAPTCRPQFGLPGPATA